MNESTEATLPEPVREALQTLAHFGGLPMPSHVELEDGRSMMIEMSMFDITGWQEEQ